MFLIRHKGFALFKQRKIEESLEIVEKSLEINHQIIVRAFELKGLIYESQGNFDESLKYLEKSGYLTMHLLIKSKKRN